MLALASFQTCLCLVSTAAMATQLCLLVGIQTVSTRTRTLLTLEPTQRVGELVRQLQSEHAPDSTSYEVKAGVSLESATTDVAKEVTISELHSFGLKTLLVKFKNPSISVSRRQNAFHIMMRASTARDSMPEMPERDSLNTGPKLILYDLNAALMEDTEARFTSEECSTTPSNHKSTAMKVLDTYSKVLWMLDGQ